eukprot:TRINITY_DN5124_c0_g1_i1.p1 TRINITY_DN5124_c0_g1~~TRINITY_DN5124_c0_g1_i1.p1  ORF type:complete len:711 (-),score=122.14 TRINITY_DN5124_c0_g1_i1:72-2141(-)
MVSATSPLRRGRGSPAAGSPGHSCRRPVAAATTTEAALAAASLGKPSLRHTKRVAAAARPEPATGGGARHGGSRSGRAGSAKCTSIGVGGDGGGVRREGSRSRNAGVAAVGAGSARSSSKGSSSKQLELEGCRSATPSQPLRRPVARPVVAPRCGVAVASAGTAPAALERQALEPPAVEAVAAAAEAELDFIAGKVEALVAFVESNASAVKGGSAGSDHGASVSASASASACGDARSEEIRLEDSWRLRGSSFGSSLSRQSLSLTDLRDEQGSGRVAPVSATAPSGALDAALQRLTLLQDELTSELLERAARASRASGSSQDDLDALRVRLQERSPKQHVMAASLTSASSAPSTAPASTAPLASTATAAELANAPAPAPSPTRRLSPVALQQPPPASPARRSIGDQVSPNASPSMGQRSAAWATPVPATASSSSLPMAATSPSARSCGGRLGVATATAAPVTRARVQSPATSPGSSHRAPLHTSPGSVSRLRLQIPSPPTSPHGSTQALGGAHVRSRCSSPVSAAPSPQASPKASTVPRPRLCAVGAPARPSLYWAGVEAPLKAGSMASSASSAVAAWAQPLPSSGSTTFASESPLGSPKASLVPLPLPVFGGREACAFAMDCAASAPSAPAAVSATTAPAPWCVRQASGSSSTPSSPTRPGATPGNNDRWCYRLRWVLEPEHAASVLG